MEYCNCESNVTFEETQICSVGKTYIVFGSKFAEFFYSNVLHFELIPGRLLGMPSNHELHVILFRKSRFIENESEIGCIIIVLETIC